MSDEEVVELSSDSIRSFNYEDVLAVSPAHSNFSLDGLPSDDEPSPSSRLISAKTHEVSSSEDEQAASSQLDVGYSSWNAASSSQSASQSSVSTQDKGLERARKAAERERLRLEKEAAKAEKARERDEKRRQREEERRFKQSQKDERKEAVFRRNQMKPTECLKYMTLVVEESLFRTILCTKALELFPHKDVKFACKEMPVANSLSWTRTQLEGDVNDEDWVGVMWSGEDVAEFISDNLLVSKINHIASIYSGKTLVLFIYAIDHYHRKSQNSRNYQARKEAQQDAESVDNSGVSQINYKYLKREEIELALVELQILTGVCHRHFDDPGGFADILGQFTKAIAEIPYKREREEVDREMGWHARSYNKNCVRANKDLQGLDKLWLQQLSVFNNTNVDTAKAIASIYPSPTTLMEAYENCENQKEKDLLLQNIQVKRSGSYSAIAKRIGPELSKKICLTFTQRDGDVRLSKK